MHVNHHIARQLASERSDALRREGAPSRKQAGSEVSLADLVAAAGGGDDEAWNRLVTTFGPMVSAVISRYRLNQADAADAAQLTWIRLYEHIDRISDPDRIGAWLATTARRQCLRTLRTHGREALFGDDAPERASSDPEPGARILAMERDAALRRSFCRLDARDQTLLGLLVASARPDYQAVSSTLDMPVGSIGPTRQRALGRLRGHLAHAGDLSLLQA
jgi:RNA polymerase sigma factor (sigma-70 family)